LHLKELLENMQSDFAQQVEDVSVNSAKGRQARLETKISVVGSRDLLTFKQRKKKTNHERNKICPCRAKKPRSTLALKT
jgi:hypothetical protein